MKSLEIRRGQANKPIKLNNGDIYDSVGYLFELDTGEKLWESEAVNTDPTNHYEGGLLSSGFYYGVVGQRYQDKTGKFDGKRVIKLFKNDVKVLSKIKKSGHTALDYTDVLLPSLKHNPNHGNQMLIGYVQVHDGGLTWDYSHGCITILNEGRDDYTRLMALLKDNEIIEINLG